MAGRPSLTAVGALATRVGRPVEGTRFPPDTPFFGLEHVRVGGLELGGVGRVDGVAGAVVPVRAGEVLLSRLRPGLRKVVVAPRDGVASPELWVLRPVAGVDPLALALALASPAFADRLGALVVGTGLPRVRWTDVRALDLPLPEPGAVAVARALAVSVIARKAVGEAARDVLVGLLAGLRGPSASVGLGVAEVRDHRGPGRVPDGTPCVGLEHLVSGSLVLDGAGRAGDARSGKLAFRAGDLLYGRLRPELRKAAIAPFEGVCSPDLLVLRGAGVGRLAAWLSGAEAGPRLAALARGTRMPRVTFADLCSAGVPVPQGEEQDRFDAVVSTALASVRAVATQLAAARAMREALVARLFTVP